MRNIPGPTIFDSSLQSEEAKQLTDQITPEMRAKMAQDAAASGMPIGQPDVRHASYYPPAPVVSTPPLQNPMGGAGIGAMPTPQGSLADQNIGMQGLRELGPLEQRGFARQAEAFRPYEDQLVEVEKQRQADEELRKREDERRLVQIQDENKLIASTEPKGAWANKPTWSKILAAISVGIGGYVAAKTGGENTALKIIEKSMDDDIKLQESKKRGAQDQVKKNQTDYDIFLKQLGDKESARQMALATGFRRAELQAKKYEAVSNSEQALAKNKILQGELQQKYLGLEATVAGKIMERQADMAKREVFTGQFDERGSPILGYARTEADAVKAKTEVPAYATVIQGLERLEAMRVNKGQVLWGEDRAEADAIAASVQSAARNITDLKSKEALKTLELLTPGQGLAGWNNKSAISKLKASRAIFQKELNDKSAQWGLGKIDLTKKEEKLKPQSDRYYKK